MDGCFFSNVLLFIRMPSYWWSAKWKTKLWWLMLQFFVQSSNGLSSFWSPFWYQSLRECRYGMGWEDKRKDDKQKSFSYGHTVCQYRFPFCELIGDSVLRLYMISSWLSFLFISHSWLILCCGGSTIPSSNLAIYSWINMICKYCEALSIMCI